MRCTLELMSEHRCFGGLQRFYRHDSREIGLPMRFGIYLPPQALAKMALPGIGIFPLNPVFSPVEHPCLPRFWRGWGRRGMGSCSQWRCLRTRRVLLLPALWPPFPRLPYPNHHVFLARLVSQNKLPWRCLWAPHVHTP